MKKRFNAVTYDERQNQMIHKSYTRAFWFAMVVLWLELVLGSFWSRIVSAEFMMSLAFWGGLTVFVTYANLKGASPFVDQRFGKAGTYLGIPATLFGLAVIIFSLFWSIAEHLSLQAIFSKGGSASLMTLGLALLCMGSSMTYYIYLNKKEENK